LVAFLVGYSTYRSWHGGLVWGSRFLVPVVPLLMLPVAEWLSVDGKVWRMATGLLVVLSLLVQFVVSTADYSFQVGAEEWDELADYLQSPVVQQFVLWRPSNYDMLWWHGPVSTHLERVYLNWRIALLPAASLLGAAAWVVFNMRRVGSQVRRASSKILRGKPWAAITLLGALFTAGTLALLFQAPAAMAGYSGVDPAQLCQVADIVNQDRDKPHAIVTISNDFHLNVLLNGFKGRFVHYWLSPVQADRLEQVIRPPFPVHSLRLIVDKVHMQPDHSGRDAEFWLNANLHRYFVDWVGSGYEVYSYLYPPDEMPLRQAEYQWPAGMAMSAYGMTPLVVAPGEPVWLEFHYSATHKPDADYDVFVQFLAPDGHFVNGTDGPPQFGARLTSRWKPGEVIVDRRAFFVPDGTRLGTYRVIGGFYRKGERQPVFDKSGRALGTHVELGNVEVVRR